MVRICKKFIIQISTFDKISFVECPEGRNISIYLPLNGIKPENVKIGNCKIFGCPIFIGRSQYSLVVTMDIYVFIEIRHIILIKWHYIEESYLGKNTQFYAWH